MNFINIISYIIIPVMTVIIVPMVRTHFVNLEARLKIMESHIQTKLTEEEARQIISDKLDPVKDSLDDIRVRIEKLTDYLLSK